eukprot:10584657-Lingulodinium_polyedra.AAC.1
MVGEREVWEEQGGCGQHEEVMMQSVQNKSDYDIGWVLPVCRLQDELGVAIEYQADGKTVLRAPDGQK